MPLKVQSIAFALCWAISLGAMALAEQTTTHTNRRCDAVTDTRSVQNEQYTNDKIVTNLNAFECWWQTRQIKEA